MTSSVTVDPGGAVPETQPTPWELMRVLREIREDQREMKRSMITRDEWALYAQANDRRFQEMAERMTELRDTSTAEHVELHARVDAVVKDVRQVEKARAEDERAAQKEASKRRFSVALAVLAAGLSVVTAIAVAVLQGALGS